MVTRQYERDSIRWRKERKEREGKKLGKMDKQTAQTGRFTSPLPTPTQHPDPECGSWALNCRDGKRWTPEGWAARPHLPMASQTGTSAQRGTLFLSLLSREESGNGKHSKRWEAVRECRLWGPSDRLRGKGHSPFCLGPGPQALRHCPHLHAPGWRWVCCHSCC